MSPRNRPAENRLASPPRRLLAFMVDLILLAFPVWIAGGLFFETTSAFGDYSRWIGWGAFMAYFTAFDSAWGGGQSFGKRALDITVVSADGSLIPAVVALARAAVVSVPVFLDYRTLSTDSLPTTAVHLIAYAALMATLYLFVFNRSSRQSLHDLALGTLVLRGAGASPAPVSTWKGHWVVVGLILLWTASNALLFASDSEDEAVTELRQIQKDVAGLPFVRSVRVVDRTQKCRTCPDRRETKFVALRLDLRHSLSDRDAVLRQLADAAFANREQFFDQRKLRIVVRRDFDLGIASVTRTERAWSDLAHWRAGTPGTWSGSSVRFAAPAGLQTTIQVD